VEILAHKSEIGIYKDCAVVAVVFLYLVIGVARNLLPVYRYVVAACFFGDNAEACARLD
jgi:hypothetical protein